MIVAFAFAGLAESDGLTLSILFGARLLSASSVELSGTVSGLRLRPLADVGNLGKTRGQAIGGSSKYVHSQTRHCAQLFDR